MKARGIDDIPLAVGGVIPKQDIAKLNAMGVKGVFPGGTTFIDIIAGIRNLIR
jgi:methylmalonyl-CoA mutase C-terminal domain/subunit